MLAQRFCVHEIVVYYTKQAVGWSGNKVELTCDAICELGNGAGVGAGGGVAPL